MSPPSAAAPSSLLSSLTRMNSSVKDLLVFIYGLSSLDLDLLFLLIKHKEPMTLEQLSIIANRDKSTIFRSLQKLVGFGICVKQTNTIKEGGYCNLYSAIDIKSLKMQTQKKVKELDESCHRLLRKFEDSIQDTLAATIILMFIFLAENI